MKKTYKLFGITVRLVFEVMFTYLMFAMINLGFDKVLWVGVGAGLIGIVFGMVEFIGSILDGENEPEEEVKTKLYAKIEEEDELFYFQVYAQNHELICVSDGFATNDGAITGLWYLMDSMKQMNELSWDFR